MPWIEKHGNGHRVVWWTAGRGSPRGHGPTVGSKKEAAAELGAMRARIAAKSTGPRREVLPWADVRDRWLLFLQEQGRTEAYRTQAREVLERTTKAWKSVDDATPEAMAGLKIGSWRIAKACLRWSRAYLGQRVDFQAVSRRPQRSTHKPKVDLLSDDEVAALVAKARKVGKRSGAALAHMVATYGHRPHSLAQVTVGHVDLKKAQITLPVKSGDTIRHPILPETVALLRPLCSRRRADSRLLLDPLGEPWTSGGKASAWFWHQVGEGVGIYQLKRYAISRMLAGGLDVATIASITGHRTPGVILKYARTNEERQQNALRVIAGAPQVPPTKAVSH